MRIRYSSGGRAFGPALLCHFWVVAFTANRVCESMLLKVGTFPLVQHHERDFARLRGFIGPAFFCVFIASQRLCRPASPGA
jgi:hypothetical protein